MEGREATTFQKLVVRGNQPMSMEQVASLSHASLGRLLADYLARISELLPNVPPPPPSSLYPSSRIPLGLLHSTMFHFAPDRPPASCTLSLPSAH